MVLMTKSQFTDADLNSQDDFEDPDENADHGERQKLVVNGDKNSDDIDVEALLQRPSISCHQQFTDFSNVFKAFIGSSLIGMPFAISNAGIVLGVVGIVFIAIATDHCCNLIVKCKHLVIKIICKKMIAEGYSSDHMKQQKLFLERCLSYGQIGKMTLGRTGTFLVNGSILITQFGFCVGYFIFLGNTARSVMYELLKFQKVHFTNTSASFPMTTYGPSLMSTSPRTYLLVSEALNETFAESNTSAIGKYFSNFTSSMPINNTLASTAMKPINMTKYPLNGKVLNNTTLHLPHIFQNFHAVLKKLKNPFTHHSLQGNEPWTFALLLSIPAPILILIAFVRNLRRLGSVSMLANFSLTGAFAATGIYMILEFQSPHETIRLFNWLKFPIFFGQITGAFEGIGTVIPIEGSMAGNQKRYPCYLHISLCLLSMILGSFGVLGYLRYGNETNQIVTENLEGSSFVIVLRCLLFFGVVFTYPLQIYPIIQIVESFLFEDKVSKQGFFGRTLALTEETEDSSTENLTSEEPEIASPAKIPVWKSNIIRAFLVLTTAMIAVVFRSQFAYIAALTGSIGSSLLSYILPCVFHIILQRKYVSAAIVAKDVALIVFGLVGGSMGLIVTIMEIIRTFGKHHHIQHP